MTKTVTMPIEEYEQLKKSHTDIMKIVREKEKLLTEREDKITDAIRQNFFVVCEEDRRRIFKLGYTHDEILIQRFIRKLDTLNKDLTSDVKEAFTQYFDKEITAIQARHEELLKENKDLNVELTMANHELEMTKITVPWYHKLFM